MSWTFSKVTSLLAPSFVLAAWAGGCGPSDRNYYCDSNGCYSCDGYGCVDVAPPTNTACTGNTSCAPGSVCTSKGCTATCEKNVDCPQGSICKSGLCAGPKDEPGKSKECTSKSDCAAGNICASGKCEACGGSNGPCPCAATSECSTGQVCANGTCTAKQNTCEFSSECGDAKVCANGACVASCEVSGCVAGFTCVASACVETKGSQCAGDGQCSGNTPKCVSGKCVESCTSDAVCGQGRFCDQGACVQDTRPKPNCTDDTACATGGGAPRSCRGGYCRYLCSNDAFCRSVDARIGYCTADGICRNEAEAFPECKAKSDCKDGKSCIANRCR